jgi:phage shock protein PspC (stress-responsive transcriptional regulator)
VVSNENNPSKWRKYLVRVIGVLAGIGLYFADIQWEKYISIKSVTALILSFFITNLIHELGHVLFGKFAGLNFSSFAVGPIQVYLNQYNSMRVRFVKHLNWFGGFASMYTRNEKYLRVRWIICVLGGPLASLISWFAFGFLMDTRSQSNFWRLVITFISYTSLLAVAATIIPYHNRQHANDGLQLLWFLRGNSQMKRTKAMILLYGTAVKGAGSREWKSKWIEDASAVKDNSPTEAIANLYIHEWALDRKQIDRAEIHLNRSLELVEKLDPVTTTALYWSQAYFLAIHKHDAVGARATFEKAGSNPLALAFYPLRTEAAVLFAEGHFEEARAKAQEGIKVYRELGSPKNGQEEFDQLEDILAKAENSLALSSSMVA